MSLYPIKLSGTGMLERERQRLLREQKELGKTSLSSLFFNNLPTAKKVKPGQPNPDSSLVLLEPLFAQLEKELARYRVTADKEKILNVKAPTTDIATRAGKIARNLAWEVFGGYAKWKAIELTTKYIARRLRRKQQN